MTDAIEAGARAKLLPCPFCGSEDLVFFKQDNSGAVVVRCEDCFGRTGAGMGENDATKRWNTRAAIASGALVPASAVAEMRERCAKLVRDVCDTQARGWREIPGIGNRAEIAATNCGVFAEQAIRQLDIAPASGDYVVGWRDISTAPSDKEILGFQATAGDHENRVAICWPVVTESRTVWFGAGGLMPTHWQPLPASSMLHAASSNGGEK